MTPPDPAPEPVGRWRLCLVSNDGETITLEEYGQRLQQAEAERDRLREASRALVKGLEEIRDLVPNHSQWCEQHDTAEITYNEWGDDPGDIAAGVLAALGATPTQAEPYRRWHAVGDRITRTAPYGGPGGADDDFKVYGGPESAQRLADSINADHRTAQDSVTEQKAGLEWTRVTGALRRHVEAVESNEATVIVASLGTLSEAVRDYMVAIGYDLDALQSDSPTASEGREEVGGG